MPACPTTCRDAKLRAKELQQQLSRLGAPFTPTQANRLSRLQSAVKSAVRQPECDPVAAQAIAMKWCHADVMQPPPQSIQICLTLRLHNGPVASASALRACAA